MLLFLCWLKVLWYYGFSYVCIMHFILEILEIGSLFGFILTYFVLCRTTSLLLNCQKKSTCKLWSFAWIEDNHGTGLAYQLAPVWLVVTILKVLRWPSERGFLRAHWLPRSNIDYHHRIGCPWLHKWSILNYASISCSVFSYGLLIAFAKKNIMQCFKKWGILFTREVMHFI